MYVCMYVCVYIYTLFDVNPFVTSINIAFSQFYPHPFVTSRNILVFHTSWGSPVMFCGLGIQQGSHLAGLMARLGSVFVSLLDGEFFKPGMFTVL